MASTSQPKRKCMPEPVCIIHVPGLKYGPLQLLTKAKDPDDKIEKLKDIKRRRMAQPPESPNRMQVSCESLPEVLEETHGYHRECYQRFTMNLGRLKQPETESMELAGRPIRRSSCEPIIFQPDCIFCRSYSRKKFKSKGSWTTEGLTNFNRDGWQHVIEVAERQNDEPLLLRIRGKDLFACEAKYHKSCRTGYIQNPEKWRSSQPEEQLRQHQIEEAHKKAMISVSEVINSKILKEKKIMKLSALLKVYIDSLQDTAHPNPDYRGTKLKKKIENYEPYEDKLAFCHMGHFQSFIVYNSQIDVDSAVRNAYQLGSTDTLALVGQQMHQSIQNAFKNSTEIKWPPTAQDLTNSETCIPSELERFLLYVISGKSVSTSARVQRLVQSIGQDICRAATNGSWRLPKHILLCMTLRHLFRSEKLITLFNRFGHCDSYSFSLELETALAEAVTETSSVLSSQIIRSPTAPAIFHSEFDNFDQLLNDMTGKSSVHTAHGIMLQDIQGDDTGGSKPELPGLSKSRQRSLDVVSQQSLPECYVAHRCSPVLIIHQLEYPRAKDACKKSMTLQNLWILLRYASKNEQQVASWNGFLSQTGKVPQRLTTIDYYPVIAEPITEYKTVQECLRYAEEATHEVNQQYVITTFDLGVCMKAFPLIWNNPLRYEKHIVMIGTFHLASAYLKMIGKKMNGSGLSDVLLEAGLIGSGSLAGVITGKHYERAMHCHKVMMEALHRLLLEQYKEHEDSPHFMENLADDSKQRLVHLAESPCEETLNAVMVDGQVTACIEGYATFCTKVRQGKLGKTAQLWISYMDHVGLVMSVIEAVKMNNFHLYAQGINRMTDLFFSFGGQNYARYLTYFTVFLANIDTSHPGAVELLERGAISVARSFIPGNRCDVDKTMEETFMRHAKSHGSGGSGVSGLLTNYSTYQRWERTTHSRSQYVNATLSMAGMLAHCEDGMKHRDVRPTEVLRSERNVAKTCDAIESFLNPFDVDMKEKLLIISSGAAASDDITKDVLGAEVLGTRAKEEFIAKRLQTGSEFFEPVKRMNLQTLGSMNKVAKVSSGRNKVTQFKHQGNMAFKLLVKSQNEGLQLDLKELMVYPLTPIPYSIGTPDGFLAKTDKSKAFHYLTKECENAVIPPEKDTLTIYDGNACFYFLKDLPSTFSQICSKVFDILSKTADVVFSTDRYLPNSVKAMERKRRGAAEKLIVKGEATRKPADWKQFLSNDENKTQFIQLLLRLWRTDEYAWRLQGRKVILVCDGVAYSLTSEDGQTTSCQVLDTLTSSQEETDSRIILYCEYAQRMNYDYVRVKVQTQTYSSCCCTLLLS